MQRDARTRSGLLGLAGLLLVATAGVGLWRLLAPSGDGGNGGTIESAPLPGGCSDVALSWPAGTSNVPVAVAMLSNDQPAASAAARPSAAAMEPIAAVPKAAGHSESFPHRRR